MASLQHSTQVWRGKTKIRADTQRSSEIVFLTHVCETPLGKATALPTTSSVMTKQYLNFTEKC